ncbi:hypothetical protein NKG94_17440 [Micromonospora sp. M12]
MRVNPQVGPAVFNPTLRTQVVGADTAAMRVQIAQAYAELRSQAGVADGGPSNASKPPCSATGSSATPTTRSLCAC